MNYKVLLFKKTIVFALLLVFSALAFKSEAQVSLTFSSGYLGTQASAAQQTSDIKNLSTLGIARVSFSQSYTGAFGGTQGNDLSGIIRLYMNSGQVISLNGALNWRETTGSVIDVFGLIFDLGQNATITYGANQTYNIIGGGTNNTSTSLGLKAYASSVTFTDGAARNGNAATSSIIGDMNAELASSPQPSSISLTNISVIESQNLVYTVTLSAATLAGRPQVYAFNTSGTATKGADYNTTFTFSNGVVDNGDGTITVPGSVSSFTITISTIDDVLVESIENVLVSVGSKTGLGSIADNDNSLIANCDPNSLYDNIVSGYHQSIAKKSDGTFAVWGGLMASDGAGNRLTPTTINATNYPGLIGTPLKTALAGAASSSNSQAIILSTDGLYAWGAEGNVLDATLTASDAFAKISTPTGGDASTKLPNGVTPGSVKMMVAFYQTLVLVTNAGNVWVLTQTNGELRGIGSVTGASTTWNKVKINVSTDLTNVISVRGMIDDANYNGLMALTADGKAYVWGKTVYLGDGTAVTTKSYATLMTLPTEFNATNLPKMIAVTGGNKTSSLLCNNTFYILSNGGNLYAIGDNQKRQIGDFTTTERKIWTRVKINSSTDFTNINYISAMESDPSDPAVVAITKAGELYTWGFNPRNMIGRPTTNIAYDPGVPGGFSQGTDKAIFAEMGGHTLVYIKEGSSQFCYVGHRIDGSMGDGSSTEADEVAFNCSGTPSLAVCGSVPVAASTSTSTITANPTSIAANGTSTSIITVQLKQSNGTNLTSTGGTVVITSNKGTISSVTDNNDGTYTAILTSSTFVETATLNYTLNGSAGTNSATVNFTAITNPVITTTGTLKTFASCSGCTVAAQSFTVAGANLTANLVVTAPTGFEVSESASLNFGPTVTLTPTTGTITTTTVYVKLINNATSASTGNVTVSSTGATSQTKTATVNTDNALNFNGTDDAVKIGQPLTTGTSYTMEAWIKHQGTTTASNIISSNNNPFFITNNTLYAGVANSYTLVSSPNFELNKWTHVAVSFDDAANTMRLYINGVQVSINTNVTQSFTLNGSEPLYIGSHTGNDINFTPVSFFNGNIDEVRVWNTVRSASDILNNMYTGMAGNETGLMAYYNFNQGIADGTNTSITNLTDNSTNAYATASLSRLNKTGATSNFVVGYIPEILGNSSVNIGSNITLTNGLIGGTWASSASGVATINANGMVTPVTSGSTTISYTICDKVVTKSITVIAPPTITTTGTLTAFTACAGSASASQTFTVSGANLSNNITITAPTGYELSTTSGGTFNSSVSLTQSGGTVNTSTIYVRLTSNALNAASGTISITSTGATTQTIATGNATVNALPTISGTLTACTSATTSLTGSGTPSNLSPWTSSATNIATVSNSGLVTGVAEGSATISYTNNIGCVATAAVTISSAPANFTITGNPIVCLSGTANFTADGSSNAIDFDGTNDVMTTASNISALNIRSNITIETWVYIKQHASDWVRLIGKSDNQTNRTYGLWLATNGQLLLQFYGTPNSPDLVSSQALTPGRWYHVAAVRNGTSLKIYIDGVESASSTYSGTPFSSTAPLQLGYAGFHTYFNGKLDDVRIWNIARTQSQIDTYKAVEIPAQTGLVAYYKFDQGTAGGNNSGISAALDASGNNYNATFNNFNLNGSSSNIVSRQISNPGGTWASADASIATVSSTGVVTAIAVGTTSISYTVTNTAGCTSQNSLTVTVPAALVAPTAVDGSRNGIGTVPIGVTVGTGETADWYASPTGGAILTSGSGTISFTTPSISTTTTYYAETRNSTTGCTSATRTGVVATINNFPTITTTGTLTTFTACAGIASTAQTFTVSGINLTNNIIITAPTGYELSETSGGTYSTSISLSQSSGTVSTKSIYVRLTNAAVNAASGTISVTSTGATTQTVATGNASVSNNPVAPVITSDLFNATVCADGSVTLTASNPAAGNAITLNGTNQKITVANGYASTNDLTYEAWVYPTNLDASSFRTIINHDDWRYGYVHFQFRGDKLQFALNNNADKYSTYTFSNNTWYHVAVVYSKSAGNVKFYVNGVLTNTEAMNPITILGNLPYTIGSWNDVRHFGGSIDEIRIWHTARTAAQILDNKNRSVPVNSSGLVAYYKADETSGTTLTNASSNALNGNIINGATWLSPSTSPIANNATFLWNNPAASTTASITVTPNATTSYSVIMTNENGCTSSASKVVTISNAPGNFGNALHFDGIDDKLTTGANSPTFTNTTTIETWVKTSNNIGYRNILSWGYEIDGSNNWGDNVQLRLTDHKLEWGMNSYSNNLTWQSLISNKNIDDGQWHHVAIVKNGNTSTMYIDGEFETSGTLPHIMTVDRFSVGSLFVLGSHFQYYNGSLDELRIWNKALTIDDIRSRMNKELIGNETNLKALYNFNVGVAGGNNTSITNINDLSTNAYHGTLNSIGLTGASSNLVQSRTFTLPSITGNTLIAAGGATSQLNNAISGGVWTISNSTYATINSSGLLTSTNAGAGTATVTYTFTNRAGCSALSTSTLITVDPASVITGPSGNAGDATSEKSVYENSTPVFSFTANETVTWSISGGVDADKFSIDATTGALSFITEPDFETPTDDNGDNTYIVTIQSSDAVGNISEQTITVTVLDIVEQPQGEINAVDFNLLTSDTVKVKFNASFGDAPFTLILSNSITSVNDTIANINDGDILTLNNNKETTIYSIVKLTDANGLTRTTDFTKDTTLVNILKPLLLLTLKAEPVKKLNDNSFTTELMLRIKNGGELNLNNVQVNANLSNIFPSYLQYKLDSVKVTNGNVSLNPSYTGRGSATAINSIDYTYNTLKSSTKMINAVLDGNYLFSNGTTLNLNEVADIKFYLSIAPTPEDVLLKLQFASSAAGVLTKSDGTISTEPTTAISDDGSNLNEHPNITNDRLPYATYLPLYPREKIGAALFVSQAEPMTGGYKYHFKAKFKNYGNVNLDSLNVIYNLQHAFPAPDSAYLISAPTFTVGNLQYNASNFNGYDNDTLVKFNGNLAVGDSAMMEYDLFVATTKSNYTWLNSMNVFARSLNSGNTISDSSMTGLDPDPSRNNDPLEANFTRVYINYIIPAPPVVNNAFYVFGTTKPANIGGLVKSTPSGTIPVWCIASTGKCLVTPPNTPTEIGRYIYELRSYDTTTLLYSDVITYDTVIIKPPVPTVKNATYIIGLATNPSNVSGLVTGMTNSTITYQLNAVKLAAIPTLGSTPGTIRYTVLQTVNEIESDTVGFTVTMLNQNDIVHLQKVALEPILQSNSTFNITYKFIVNNLSQNDLTNVLITDNLQNTIPITCEYNIVSIRSTGGLIANSSFNGSTNIYLSNATSKINALAKDTIVLTLNLKPKGFFGIMNNTATIAATTPYGAITMVSSASTKATETSKTPTPVKIPDVIIDIPEVFTPNKDGVNDRFVIIKPFGTTLQLEIFNRWGNIVYNNPNYNNEWDGRGTNNFIGQDLLDGGYYYNLKATNSNGETKIFKGFVIIQR